MAGTGQLIRRFITPGWWVSLVCLKRYRAKVSPQAEVEVTDFLRMGRGAIIGSYSKIKCSDGPLEIGEGAMIGTHCFISSHPGGVKIGDHSMLGPFVSVLGNDYQYDRLDVPISLQPKTSKGVIIGKGVWLGAGVVVLDGAQIGDGAIITPNSVVSGKINANTVAQGNPAKPIFVRRA
jgi:acetyltransferase-like isoleucine patch superfamily enzyme